MAQPRDRKGLQVFPPSIPGFPKKSPDSKGNLGGEARSGQLLDGGARPESDRECPANCPTDLLAVAWAWLTLTLLWGAVIVAAMTGGRL